jgi:hypothetical protein
MKPKAPKPRNITAFKIKRHPTTVDNVSTSRLFLLSKGIIEGIFASGRGSDKIYIIYP